MNVAWDAWSEALISNFARQLSFHEWNRLVEASIQKPNESGMEYALEDLQTLTHSDTWIRE